MVYYHVRISVQGQRRDEVKNDLNEETLENQVLAPYRNGYPVTMNGKTYSWDQVDRVRVSVSDVPSAALIEQIRAADRSSSVAVVGGAGYGWRAAARATDVTDQLITGPPGSAQQPVPATEHNFAADPTSQQASEGSLPDSRAVFVVAGRDSRASSAIGALLRALGLHVIEWEHAVARTGLPNPYVGDVVEAGLRMAGAAVVLLTPDDLVRLRDDLLHENDGSEERDIRGQARPNVYYEAGIADALGRERTVIIEMGNVKSFSDVAGRHVVRYDGSAARRHALAERLRLAGLTIDTGGQDWLTAGDVTDILQSTRVAIQKAGKQASEEAIVDQAAFIQQIDVVFAFHDQLTRRAKYEDLSDLAGESLELTFRAQALIDRFAADTPYALEAERVRGDEPVERIPILLAALRSLRAEAVL